MSAGREVRCVEFVEIVTEWMEGALTDTKREEVEEHIAICPDCTVYLGQLRDTVVVLGDLAEEAPVEPARERLFAEFRRVRDRTD